MKTPALIFLILSYLALLFIFVFENELQNIEFPYFFVVWAIGIINLVLNIFYGIKIELKTWLLVLLIISGMTWLFLPLIFTFFGIPFLLIYLAIGVYIHRQKISVL